DRESEQTSPHYQPMSGPGGFAAPKDKAVEGEVRRNALEPVCDVSAEMFRSEEDLPSPLKIESCRRPLQPHCIAVGDAESREKHGEGVSDERGIEVLQTARAEYNQYGHR